VHGASGSDDEVLDVRSVQCDLVLEDCSAWHLNGPKAQPLGRLTENNRLPVFGMLSARLGLGEGGGTGVLVALLGWEGLRKKTQAGCDRKVRKGFLFQRIFFIACRNFAPLRTPKQPRMGGHFVRLSLALRATLDQRLVISPAQPPPRATEFRDEMRKYMLARFQIEEKRSEKSLLARGIVLD